jgi:hypothetical protein
MAKKKNFAWGKWAFTLSWVLAILLAVLATFGIQPIGKIPVFLLVVFGLLVGWLYKAKDVMPFLWTTLLFILLLQFAPLIDSGYYVGAIIGTFFELFKVFLGTAGLVVAFKKIYLMLN